MKKTIMIISVLMTVFSLALPIKAETASKTISLYEGEWKLGDFVDGLAFVRLLREGKYCCYIVDKDGNIKKEIDNNTITDGRYPWLNRDKISGAFIMMIAYSTITAIWF